MVRRPGWGGWLASLGFLLCPAHLAHAQSCKTAVLRVQVRDSAGNPIADARVGAGTPAKALFTHDTSPDGSVEFDLSCGSWVIRAGKDGFQEELSTLDLSDQAEIKLALQPEV